MTERSIPVASSIEFLDTTALEVPVLDDRDGHAFRAVYVVSGTQGDRQF
jgi:hypothetical protein